MKKNQIIAVAVAVMLVAVCAIGVIMFMNNDNEGNSESGILLSYGKYDNEWVEMDTEGLTVNDAFNEALGSDTLGTNEPDPSEWTLWTASGNAKDWTKNTTGDWNTMKVRDFRVIAFSETDEKPILPTDQTGVSLFSMMGPKERIVSLSASITEKIDAVGLTSKIVGTDSYSDYPQEILDRRATGYTGPNPIASLGSYWGVLNFEGIVNTNPDIVIADVDATGQSDIITKLRAAGITVLGVTSHKGTVEEVCESIYTMGFVMGKASEAKAAAEEIEYKVGLLSDYMTAYLENNNITNNSVLFVMPPYDNEYYVAAQQTTMTSMLSALGLTNVISENVGWMTYNKEMLIEKDPNIVIVMGTYDAYNLMELNDPGQLGAINAVQEGKVCEFVNMADSVLSRPGPRIVDAMAMICFLMAENDWTDTDNQWYRFDNDYSTHIAELWGKVIPIV